MVESTDYEDMFNFDDVPDGYEWGTLFSLSSSDFWLGFKSYQRKIIN